MALPGISDEKELKLLLKKLLENKDEVYKFALAASGPRDGTLMMSKKEKLKKDKVKESAEQDAKEKNDGKAVKLDVMTGECRLDASNAATLRLIVYGKAPAKAVACFEHLLARGPYKAIGFTNVILEEVEESSDEAPTADNPAAAEFGNRLKAIKPQIDGAIVAATPTAQQIKAAVGEMAKAAKGGDFSAAGQHLDTIESLLKSASASSTASPPADAQTGSTQDGTTELSHFTNRLSGIKLDLDRALKSDHALVADLKKHAATVSTAAKSRDFTQAHAALDEAELLIRRILARPSASDELKAGGVNMALVKERAKFAAARGTWERIRNRTISTIELIRDKMLEEFSDEPELQENLKEGVKELNALASGFTMELKEKFDAFLQEPAPPEEERASLRRAALGLIRAYRGQVESDTLYNDLDEKEFADVLVKAPLLEALTGLEKDLA